MRWLAQILGYPADAEGILVSGGSMANFTALAAARRAHDPGQRARGGPGGRGPAAPDRVRVGPGPSCVDKAVDLLGIGTSQLRKIETDERFRIRMDLLARGRRSDRRAGFAPAIVVGNAGTVNTGAIDPLRRSRDLCRRETLWFHVDGAYGAMAALSAGPAAALCRNGASRLDRRRPAQVALRAVRGRSDAGAGARTLSAHLPQIPRVPRLGPRDLPSRTRPGSPSGASSCRAASRRSRSGWD